MAQYPYPQDVKEDYGNVLQFPTCLVVAFGSNLTENV